MKSAVRIILPGLALCNVLIAADIEFSPGSGFFEDEAEVRLSSGKNGTIRYTLDGSSVSSGSAAYSGPIKIDRTTILRTRVFNGNTANSDDISQIYLVDFAGHLPVLSLATDEANLYGSRGIYDHPKESGDSWEKPVSVNLVELDGSGFQINAGIRIHGQHSRTYDKKSFRLYFRSDYGEGKLDYRLFEMKNLDKFDQLVVHSGGSFDQPGGSAVWTFLRDPLCHALWYERGGNIAAFRPVLLFLNGDFWGIYHIRERINDDYLSDNYDIAGADLLEWSHQVQPQVKEGDLNRWNETYSFFENNDLSSTANYQRARDLIDIDNFIDYNIVEIFYGHRDWPHNNVFFFRPREAGGRWQWILWDAEATFIDTKIKTLEWATRDDVRPDISPSDTISQLFGTLLLRSLLRNEAFRNKFISRFADFLNTSFDSDHVSDIFDEMVEHIERDVPLEVERWQSSMSEWNAGLSQVRRFISERSGQQRQQLRNYFGLSSEITVRINANSGSAGSVRINRLQIDDFPWDGRYFAGIPIEIEAVAHDGYVFSHWSGISENNRSFEASFSSDISITSNFVAEEQPPSIDLTSRLAADDTLFAGESYEITWSGQGDIDSVLIEFTSDGGSFWQRLALVDASVNKFRWQVPFLFSNQCNFRLSDQDENATAVSLNSFFTVAAPSLTVTKPNGGEIWFSGETQEVTWRSWGPIGDVRLEISFDGGADWQILAETHDDDGTFGFQVGDSLSDQCQVRVVKLADSRIFDESDNFFEISHGSLQIEAPEGTMTIEGGSTLNIVWTSSGRIDSVLIEVSLSDSAGWSKLAAVANTGRASWLIPNVRADSVLLRISDLHSLGSYSYLTEPLRIEHVFLEIINPVTNRIYYTGQPVDISWSYGGTVDSVRVEISGDDGLHWSPVFVLPNTESFKWTILDSLSGLIFFAISEAADGVPADTVGSIEIARPFLTLDSPAGGESLAGGTEQEIEWQSSGGIDSVLIDYSLNMGITWSHIDRVENTGHYSWLVPEVSSDSALIRISGIEDWMPGDTTGSGFKIEFATEVSTYGQLPIKFALHQNYPNPFNAETSIGFDLPENIAVTIEIRNLLGERVRLLVDQQLPAGSHIVHWDGLGEEGAPAGSGIFFYSISTEGLHVVRKMLMLK